MLAIRIGYPIKEAMSHFSRNIGTSIGAVVTIFLSLFIIGLFMQASLMINNVVGDVESKVTIQAFVSDNADQASIDALKTKINGMEEVESVSFKNKDEALAEYKETMKSRSAADAIAQLDGQNPVPASLVIKLNDPQMVKTVADRISSDPAFITIADVPDNPESSVQYGQQSVERLFTVTNYARVIAVVLVALLTFIAFVFINNTIRLSIMARRLEIGIMRLVGANNSFIRGPFIMEGIIQAILGALLAIGSLELIHHLVMPKLQQSISFLELSISLTEFLYIYGLLVAAGLLIGLFGSTVAMRRYLKV